ncbi:single-stranded-DNA-specific exonuclease RecJ [Gimesia maris]|uniref:single-stranded-DNA-specific exonuclease RecJ n=1 Tax=Gimesia maris TaxID=122 RepID=UPI00241C83D8|nr:single-stranded-DNA-specific exonuclease RecJ [Gimesia maris]|tara:strand:- start:70929 stop:72692 length:1764 start_codon:yes stop_codon:yes gene_type:complete
MTQNWRFAPHDESQVRRLSSEMRISPLLAQVLIARGLQDAAAARSFIDARMTELLEPCSMPGVESASDRIVAALKDKRRITIYGDYDVDGMTATSILLQCITLANGKCDYFIPNRLDDGYGLNCDAIRQLHEEDPQRLLITVDCGITSVQEAALARELGLELIITDHHQMAEELPAADCLVHPRLPDSDYEFPHLCGAGVALKLAWAVCQKLGDGQKASPQMREYLKCAVGLAAIGTIADVVPLVGENRILVRYGLSALAERAPLGLQELMKVAEIKAGQMLDTEDIGFAIAPRLNAAGRLGQARLAVELLTTSNQDRASQLAAYLDELNKNRRTVERRIFKQAKEMVEENVEWEEHHTLVLAHADWHPGVIGIVANRVSEHFEKPTVLIALDATTRTGQGSARSFAGFDLHAGFSSCSAHLVRYGGHQAAAGLKIEEDKIENFRQAFAEYAADAPKPSEDELLVRIDAEVCLNEITKQAVRELDCLGPFGQENPRPQFVATRVQLAEPPRTMGEGGRHLSLVFQQHNTKIRAIAFGKGEWATQMDEDGGPFSISFAPGINRFRGFESVQLQLKDWVSEKSEASIPS